MLDRDTGRRNGGRQCNIDRPVRRGGGTVEIEQHCIIINFDGDPDRQGRILGPVVVKIIGYLPPAIGESGQFGLHQNLRPVL